MASTAAQWPPSRELLALQRPLRVLAQAAVLADERSALCASPRSCQSSQLTATDAAAPPFGSRIRAAVADGQVRDGDRHVRDPREVVHAVRVRDVFRSAEDVDRRRVQRRQHVLADVHARESALPPSLNTPVFCSTIVFTRGSFATCSACRPPQLQPDSATSAGSMRPKNGLPDALFSASAQSIASVRSDAFVRGG